jgi:hypothetical protein
MNTDKHRTTYSSDDSTDSGFEGDNLNREEQENSANGLDSTEVTDGQNGRNIRAMGSQDMDSQNGVLRQNDTADGAMDVPEEALANAAASEGQTKTSTVSVTTAGPDDYASDSVVSVPNAQQEAKKQAEKKADDFSEENTSESGSNSSVSQEETEDDVAETGTSTDHQPTY